MCPETPMVNTSLGHTSTVTDSCYLTAILHSFASRIRTSNNPPRCNGSGFSLSVLSHRRQQLIDQHVYMTRIFGYADSSKAPCGSTSIFELHPPTNVARIAWPTHLWQVVEIYALMAPKVVGCTEGQSSPTSSATSVSDGPRQKLRMQHHTSETAWLTGRRRYMGTA